MTTGGGIKTVRHAIDVLRCFSASDPLLGVNEVAKRTGLHKSSVSRLMATLADLHILERDPGSKRFRLGDGLFAIAAPLFNRKGLVETVRPMLEKLAAAAGETASFNIWDGQDAVVIESAAGSTAIGHFSPVGMRNPAHCTSSGKVLLAFAPQGDIDAVLVGGLRRFTTQSTTDPVALKDELGRIRATGIAINAGAFREDVGAVAAIVPGPGGRIFGAVSVSVPMYRFGADRQAELSAMVATHARQLSAALGHGLTV